MPIGDEQDFSFDTEPEVICATPEPVPEYDVTKDDDEWLIIYHSSRLLV